MKFAVVTYGTEGDTRPLAALCRALMDAGHETLLLADKSTLGAALALGVPSAPLAGDIREAIAAGAAVSDSNAARALARIANGGAEKWMRDVVAAGSGCDAIVVSGLAGFVGLSVAEYLGIRAIGTGLIPITPTDEFASPFLRPDWVPRWLNNVSHHAVNGLLWRMLRKSTNAARARVCSLAPRRLLWTEHPMLYGISRHLVPNPGDWPDNARVCGQWVQPSPHWEPPQALNDFLTAGVPPIYVGFGSMAGFDRQRLLNVLIVAVAGRRALFFPGWSGVEASELPDNFHILGDTPHSWLFPRTSLIIHHGGSGTTHSAARSGVPSVVLPFAADQFFWADRLRRAGVAAAPVSVKNLRAAALARGIDYAESAEARSRATALGAKMSTESGLAAAVGAIERLMQRKMAPLGPN